MAKENGSRGWRKWIPMPPTIVKVLLASFLIHQVTALVYPRLPENIRQHWPRI